MRQFSSSVVKIKKETKDENGKDIIKWIPIPALRGSTPYEVAKAHGYTGTEDEWYDLMFDSGWIASVEALNRRVDNVYTKTEIDDFNMALAARIDDLVIQKITTSTTWIAPKSVGQKFKVFCVGAGGGGGNGIHCSMSSFDTLRNPLLGGGGGGSGFIEIKTLEISEGEEIDIKCGAGGTLGNSGGHTEFGTLLIGEGGYPGGNATSSSAGNGGNGGAGGGGGSCPVEVYSEFTIPDSITPGKGGDGSFGGGGGAGGCVKDDNRTEGGKGGVHGGNGGTRLEHGSRYHKRFDGSLVDALYDAELILNLPFLTSGSALAHGNGGNGGLGGTASSNSNHGCGGGGGFGGAGGESFDPSSLSYNETVYARYSAGAGGGGYFGNGGNGGNSYFITGLTPEQMVHYGYPGGAGGGGFFCHGAKSQKENGGGGGGFFSDANGSTGGDGGVLIMYIKETEE